MIMVNNHSQHSVSSRGKGNLFRFLSLLFHPKATKSSLAGLLARSVFCGLPVRQPTNSGKVGAKTYQNLQLRGQLRFFTGFPIIPNREPTTMSKVIGKKLNKSDLGQEMSEEEGIK